MSFGDGTHSREGPDFPYFTFTQKSKCGGRMVKVSPQVPYRPKAILDKKKKMMMMSALPC
jgi:hypothetical protein